MRSVVPSSIFRSQKEGLGCQLQVQFKLLSSRDLGWRLALLKKEAVSHLEQSYLSVYRRVDLVVHASTRSTRSRLLATMHTATVHRLNRVVSRENPLSVVLMFVPFLQSRPVQTGPWMGYLEWCWANTHHIIPPRKDEPYALDLDTQGKQPDSQAPASPSSHPQSAKTPTHSGNQYPPSDPCIPRDHHTKVATAPLHT